MTHGDNVESLAIALNAAKVLLAGAERRCATAREDGYRDAAQVCAGTIDGLRATNERLTGEIEGLEEEVVRLRGAVVMLTAGHASALLAADLAGAERMRERASAECRGRAAGGGAGNSWCLDCAEAIDDLPLEAA